MPTGTRRTIKTHRYHGTIAEQFDVLDAIGGKLVDIGERIRKAAIHFPVSEDWILSDLLEAAEFATRIAEKMQQAIKAQQTETT